MTKLLKTSVAMCCAAYLIPLHAEEAPGDEIIVTAKGNQTQTNVLHTAHVLTLEDIELAQVKDLPELLDSIAGISVRDSGGRGSATSVFVRGTSNSQTIVLIDGVRVGSATLGAAALNSYPIEAVERIEVLKGPFSGLYGADAVGGVIQIFTKKGGDNNGAVSATIGSDSLNEFDAAISLGDNRNSFHIAAHSEDTDGIDRTSITSGGNGDIDGFEETAVSLGARVSFGESTVANLSVLASENTVDFDDTFGSDFARRTENKALSTALSIDSRLSDSLNWKTTLGVNEDEAETFSSFGSKFITNRDSLGTELSLSLSSDSTLTFGADYYEEAIESSNEFPVEERDNKGAFAQYVGNFSSFGIAASLRYDDNSSYGSNTNGSISLSHSINDELRLIASYGTAFDAPSFNFLYFPFFGNPDILPEESESAELSLVGNHDNLNWRLSAYKTDVENLFSFDPVTFTAANIGEAELEGIEAQISGRWSEWELSLNADVLSATDQITGGELDDRAERTLALTASRDFGKLNLRFDLKTESNRFDLSGTELSGYGLFDVSAVYEFTDKLSLSANVDNIFDKDYTVNLINASERYNTEGRQAKLRVRYQF